MQINIHSTTSIRVITGRREEDRTGQERAGQIPDGGSSDIGRLATWPR